MPGNKVREIFIARRLERIYSKKEILNYYLNTVPFSQNIYGVKVASQRFFGTPPAQLGPEEAAVLVGMLKATTAYNPLRNPERSTQRRNVVLAQMVKYDYLPATSLDSLQALPLQLSYYQEGNNEGPATYFREQLRGELDALLKDQTRPDGTPYNLYTDGLRIETTIDAGMQAYAEEAVHTHLIELQAAFLKHWEGKGKAYGNEELVDRSIERSGRYRRMVANGASEAAVKKAFDTPVQVPIYDWKSRTTIAREISPRDSVRYYLSLLNAGFLVMDPADGAVQAWVGGIAHEYFKYDHVRSRRQVGSTFKPIVYAAALEAGQEPCAYINNRLVSYTEWEGWQPRNSDEQYGGVYSMQGGLMGSVNSVTVDVIMRTGIDTVAELARQLGVNTDVPKVPAIALGAAEISLADMVRVYAAFANGGERVQPYYLTKVTDRTGRILFESTPDESEPVLQAETTQLLTHFLESVVDSGTARRLRYLYKVTGGLAGKTGTTQDQTDGWFLGYTPELAFGAWVGAEQPAVRWNSLTLGQGANTALPIAGRFLNLLYADPAYRAYRSQYFPPLPDSTAALVDCAPYLDEMPVEPDNWWENEDGGSILDWFNQRQSRPQANSRRPRTRTRQQQQAELNRRREEIRKQNERLDRKRQRQAKRKRLLDRIFN